MAAAVAGKHAGDPLIRDGYLRHGPLCAPAHRPAPDLARAALDQHGIAVKRLRWMGQHDNHLFRCDTADGERLVVRVCPPGGHSDAELAR